MLEKIQIEAEDAMMNRLQWTEWFLKKERENVLKILVKSYGSRFRVAELEDIVQEASLVVWETIMRTEEKDRNVERIKRLMIRVCRNMLSHAMRHLDEVESMDCWTQGDRWEKVGELMNRDEETDRVRRERFDLLLDSWDKLSDRDRLVLTKTYWENKSMIEIALELKLKNGQVAKNYKSRVMKLLREMMKLRQS